MDVISIGFGNFLNKNRIVSVVNPNSAPMKKLKEQLKKDSKMIDATEGRKTRSIIVMDSGHIVLSGLASATIAERMDK